MPETENRSGGPCLCSDNRKTQLPSHIAQWGMRSLIIELKSEFCSVSAMGTLIATSNDLQLTSGQSRSRKTDGGDR